jgi:hypothetical protein
MRYTCCFAITALAVSLTVVGASVHQQDQPEPVLGPEVLVSDNADGGRLRCEPSAAMHGPTVVVAWNDTSGGRLGAKTGVRVGWAWSEDAGRSFKFGGYLPATPAGTAPSAADSWLVANREGKFFLTILAFDEKSAVDEIQSYAMAPNRPGVWVRKANARTLQRSPAEPYLDKPALAIGPDGKLGCVYTQGTKVACVFSSDEGATWSAPVEVSQGTARSRLGSHLILRGETVVVAWMEGGGISLDEVWHARSTDGGKTFAPAEQLYKLKKLLTSVPGLKIGLGVPFLVPTSVWLDFLGSGNGVCLFAAVQEAAPEGSRIVLLEVSQPGKPTADPVVVGAPALKAHRFFPSLASGAGGLVAVYYDRRNAPASTLTDVYATVLATPRDQRDLRITSVATDWEQTPGDKEFAPIQRTFGDYITVCADGDGAFVVWTDGRTGSPQIMGRRMTLPPRRPSLR